MADLTANANIRFKGEIHTIKRFIDTSAARQFYRGQPALIDQSADATGNVAQYVDSLTVAATDVFVGISLDKVSVASGDPETTEVKLVVEPTIVGFKSAVFSKGADEGKTAYFSDSATLSATATANVQVGKIDSIEDGYVYIRLVTPQICAGA